MSFHHGGELTNQLSNIGRVRKMPDDRKGNQGGSEKGGEGKRPVVDRASRATDKEASKVAPRRAVSKAVSRF
jgi:hypothetical protein